MTLFLSFSTPPSSSSSSSSSSFVLTKLCLPFVFIVLLLFWVLLLVVPSPVVVVGQDQPINPERLSPSSSSPPLSATALGVSPLDVVLVNDKRQSVTIRQCSYSFRSEGCSKLHLSESDVTMASLSNLLVVIVCDALWKLLSATDGVVLSRLIFISVLSLILSGSLVALSSLAVRIGLWSSLNLDLFQIQSCHINRRLACSALFVFILASSDRLLISSASCSSLISIDARQATAIPIYRWSSEISSCRRAILFRLIFGGSWGNPPNPNSRSDIFLVGYCGPTVLIRFVGLILEVVREYLGLGYGTLGILFILAQTALCYSWFYDSASLSDSTSPVRESKKFLGFYPITNYPGWESPVQRLSTALKRTSFGILVAACSWSSFGKRKTTLVKQLDPIEERYFSMPLEVLSFTFCIVMLSRSTFYRLKLWFEDAIKLSLEFVIEPYY